MEPVSYFHALLSESEVETHPSQGCGGYLCARHSCPDCYPSGGAQPDQEPYSPIFEWPLPEDRLPRKAAAPVATPTGRPQSFLELLAEIPEDAVT